MLLQESITPSHTSAAPEVYYLLRMDRKWHVSAQPVQPREAMGAPGTPFLWEQGSSQLPTGALPPPGVPAHRTAAPGYGSLVAQLCPSGAGEGEPGHQGTKQVRATKLMLEKNMHQKANPNRQEELGPEEISVSFSRLLTEQLVWAAMLCFLMVYVFI